MTDKEVGELWQRFSPHEHQQERHRYIVGLIRKLVEERRVILANKYYAEFGDQIYPEEFTQEALRDFGIDEKEWPG